jgi:hypothetical protein
MADSSSFVYPQRNPPTITSTVNDQTESNVSTQSSEESVSENDTQEVKSNSGFVYPQRTSPIPVVNKRTDQIKEEIESVDFANELNPEMVFELKAEEQYALENIPVMQDQYFSMIQDQLKKDPENPHLKKEIERISDFPIEKDEQGFYTAAGEIKLDEELELILQEKLLSSRKELFSPEMIQGIRNNIDLAYKDRQKLENDFARKFDIKAAGYDNLKEYLKAERPEMFEKYGENIGQTKQEMFNEAIKKREEGLIRSLNMAHYLLRSESPVTRKAAELVIKQDGNLSAMNFKVMLNEVFNPATAIADMNVDAARFDRQSKGFGRKFMDVFRSADNKKHSDDQNSLWQYTKGMTGAALWTMLDGMALAPPVALVKKSARGFRYWINDPVYNQSIKARKASAKYEAEIRAKARAKVDANPEIQEKFIDQFEAKAGYMIHKVVNGKRVFDREKIREVGLIKTREMSQARGPQGQRLDISDDPTVPLLDVDTIDGVVATLIDLQKVAPEEFGKGKTLIDDMVRVFAEGKVDPEKLLPILGKNGITLEELVVGTYSSVSKAGEILGTWSRISKNMTVNKVNDLDNQIKAKKESVISHIYTNYFLRSEAIAKGALVAPIAVAARNLKSAFIREPLEIINNVISNAILEFSRKGIKDGAKSLIPYSPNSAYTGSMDTMKYMMSNQRDANNWARYILSQSKDHERMIYNTLNEIQINLGRGQASKKPILGAPDRVADQIFSDLEDFVAVLNTPNRIQELAVRNATFYAEIKRLVKKEYGVDFEGALSEGKLMDFFRDAEAVRPANARPFANLMDDAVNRALRKTYSAQPEYLINRKIANIISRSPATILIPFPRFLFNGLEYFGELAGGAVGPVSRKLWTTIAKDSKFAGPLTARESEKIANNAIGLGIFVGMNYLLDQDPDQIISNEEDEKLREERGNNYQMIGIPFTNYEMNILGDYPVPQMSWILRAHREAQAGTFDDWDAKNDYLELFLGGGQARTGVTNIAVDYFTDLLGGVQDAPAGAKRDLALGKALGAYATRFINPLFQTIELEREMGIRTTDRKQSGKDFLITDNQFQIGTSKQPTSRAGNLFDPEIEKQMSNKVTITDTGETRDNILFKIFLGTNIRERNAKLDYFSEIGIDDPNFQLGSDHSMYSVQDFQNEKISKRIDDFINSAKQVGKSKREEWKNNEFLQEKYTISQYSRIHERASLLANIRNYRAAIGEGKALIDTRLEKRTDQFMKLGSDKRKKAIAMFHKMRGIDVDFTDYKHLEYLLMYGGVNLIPKKQSLGSRRNRRRN